jgi:hypothetical protein
MQSVVDTDRRDISLVSSRLLFVGEQIQIMRREYLASQRSLRAYERNLFIKDIAKLLFRRDWRPKLLDEGALKHRESELGATLFGSSAQKQIMFFCDDASNWYFYQGILDQKNPKQTMISLTLHYEVRQDYILRIDNHGGKVHFKPLDGDEFDNFVRASELYYKLVATQIYRRNVF